MQNAELSPPNVRTTMPSGISEPHSYYQLPFNRVGYKLFSRCCCHRGFVCIFEEESQEKQSSLPKNISLPNSGISQGYQSELWVLHSA